MQCVGHLRAMCGSEIGAHWRLRCLFAAQLMLASVLYLAHASAISILFSAPNPAKMARTKASAKKSAGGKSPKAKASKKTTKTARKAGKGGKRRSRMANICFGNALQL